MIIKNEKREFQDDDAELYGFFKLLIFLLAIFLVAIIYQYVGDSDSYEEEKALFENDNASFLCKNISETYLVNRQYGWSIYKDEYFKKEDLLLDISKCTKE